jgi:hypothetical protein
MEEVGIEQDRGRDEGDEEGMEEKGLSRMVERDGFFQALRSEDVSPPPVLRAPTWGCCSTGSCYIRGGLGAPKLGLLQPPRRQGHLKPHQPPLREFRRPLAASVSNYSISVGLRSTPALNPFPKLAQSLAVTTLAVNGPLQSSRNRSPALANLAQQFVVRRSWWFVRRCVDCCRRCRLWWLSESGFRAEHVDTMQLDTPQMDNPQLRTPPPRHCERPLELIIPHPRHSARARWVSAKGAMRHNLIREPKWLRKSKPSLL